MLIEDSFKKVVSITLCMTIHMRDGKFFAELAKRNKLKESKTIILSCSY